MFEKFDEPGLSSSEELKWLEDELRSILCWQPEGRMIELSYVERVAKFVKRLVKNQKTV